MRITLFTLVFLGFCSVLSAQRAGYWQQRADYTMAFSLDAETHEFTGTQTIRLTNNAPEALDRLFYHLYFNAFQKESGMWWRNKTVPDADNRSGHPLLEIKPEDEGYIHVSELKVDGKSVRMEENGTILEVWLDEPIQPGQTAELSLAFEGKVPLQTRRSGRDSKEGIDYSMSQWYPKLCQYDENGWHPNPYLGQEFYGIWGDWDVKITLPKEYIVGGTGYLQNPNEIGYGYEDDGAKVNRPKDETLTWHFKAPNVHDFVWAADPDYTHKKVMYADTLALHFLYQEKDNVDGAWDKLPDYTLRMFEIISQKYGRYPYRQYSFIQGGDGGMEYPMATLITGKRQLSSLIGVAQHELLHTWFQMIFATNEVLVAWMDEGFNTYAGGTVDHYVQTGKPDPDPFYTKAAEGNNRTYKYIVQSGQEEPLTTHADHFNSNTAYSIAAYIKGAVYLSQLSYVVGMENFEKGMLRYYDVWKFKHPKADDFLKIMELESGLVLDWYNEYFVNSTKSIDYAITGVEINRTVDPQPVPEVVIERKGRMPMPLDVVVTYKDGSQKLYYIPLELMRGEKPHELGAEVPRTVATDWAWPNPTYRLQVEGTLADIDKIELDPTHRMADMDLENNVWTGN